MEFIRTALDWMSPGLNFIKDWNFFVPVGIWVYVRLHAWLKGRKLRIRLWSTTAIRIGEVRLISEVVPEPARLGHVGSMEEAQALQVVRDLVQRTGVAAAAHLERPPDLASADRPQLLILVGSGGPGSGVENVVRSFEPDFAFTSRGFQVGGQEFTSAICRRSDGRMSFDSEAAIIASVNGDSPNTRRLVISSRYGHTVLRVAAALAKDPYALADKIVDATAPWYVVCEWDNRRDLMTLLGYQSSANRKQVER